MRNPRLVGGLYSVLRSVTVTQQQEEYWNNKCQRQSELRFAVVLILDAGVFVKISARETAAGKVNVDTQYDQCYISSTESLIMLFLILVSKIKQHVKTSSYLFVSDLS